MSNYPKDSGGVGVGRHYHQAPLTAASAAAMPPKQRQPRTHGQKQRTSNKSQPFDADDLRRRLYVVLAEQDSSRKEERYARMEKVAAAARARQEERKTVDGVPGIAKGDDYGEGDEEGGEDGLVEAKRASVGSCRGSDPTSTTAPYRHVPQVAASQFVRTTTTESIDNDNKKRLQALSYSALRVHASDGGDQSERATNNNNNNNNNNNFNGIKLQSKRSLRRVQSQWDDNHMYYERTQQPQQQQDGQHFHYQNPRFIESCTAAATGTDNNNNNNRQKRHSMKVYGKPSFGDLSSSSTNMMNMNEIYTRRSRSAPLEDFCCPTDTRNDEYDSAAAAAAADFVPDLATVSEYQRPDWTQSDEIRRFNQQAQQQQRQQNEQQYHENGDQKRRSSLSRLHRVESILTLKAKLGNLIRPNHYNNNNNNNKGEDRPVVATIIHEEEVSASTTRTASSSSAAGSSPKSSARRGFLGRFRR